MLSWRRVLNPPRGQARVSVTFISLMHLEERTDSSTVAKSSFKPRLFLHHQPVRRSARGLFNTDMQLSYHSYFSKDRAFVCTVHSLHLSWHALLVSSCLPLLRRHCCCLFVITIEAIILIIRRLAETICRVARLSAV